MAALVLTQCEAFDNVPPGLPGAVVSAAAHLPGGLWLAALALAVPGVDRLPLTLGLMSRRTIPRAMVLRWAAPARRDARVRADLRSHIRPASARWQEDTTQRLQRFRGRALVCWRVDDAVMPSRHGPMLRDLLDAQLVVLPRSRTLVPIDAPLTLAGHVRAYLDRAPRSDPS